MSTVQVTGELDLPVGAVLTFEAVRFIEPVAVGSVTTFIIGTEYDFNIFYNKYKVTIEGVGRRLITVDANTKNPITIGELLNV